jgi:crossover junction endodeoxyribonuclease RuvC
MDQGPLTVGLELVHAMPGQGVTSMFSMGRGVGIWEGILAGLRIPFDTVTPQAWKKLLLGKGAGDDKNASILRAQALIPGAAEYLSRAKDDGRAEAMLIAEYFRRTRSALRAA